LQKGLLLSAVSAVNQPMAPFLIQQREVVNVGKVGIRRIFLIVVSQPLIWLSLEPEKSVESVYCTLSNGKNGNHVQCSQTNQIHMTGLRLIESDQDVYFSAG